MEHVRSNPNAVMRALDAIAQSNALLAEKLITEAGCDGVYYCVQSGEPNRFKPEEYRKIACKRINSVNSQAIIIEEDVNENL